MEPVQGSGKDDRGSDALAAQGAKDKKAVQAGQHAVQDDSVIRVVLSVKKAVVPGVADVGGIAGLFQGKGDETAQILVVFNNQDSHKITPWYLLFVLIVIIL
jgi:hypothetical protein